MKKDLTFYCIRYGKSPNIFLIITDNSIPFKIICGYVDVLNSVILETFVNKELIEQIKKICKDTGMTAILNTNHPNKQISEITKLVLGNKVYWKEYSFKAWNKYIRDISSFCSYCDKIVEIDHPINFKDKDLVELMIKGFEIATEKMKAMNIKFPKLKKRGLKNGK